MATVFGDPSKLKMNIVIDKLGEILSSAPDPVLGAGNINSKIPGSGSELPAFVVSLTIESYEANGLGRFENPFFLDLRFRI